MAHQKLAETDKIPPKSELYEDDDNICLRLPWRTDLHLQVE